MEIAVIGINLVPVSLIGSEEANEMLQHVYAGKVSITEAQHWVAELHREGLAQLAVEVAERLPCCH